MTKVVIANRWTDPEGRVYEGGETAEVEPGVARDLIMRGKAREAPTQPEPEAPAAETEVEAPVAAKNPKTEPPKSTAKAGKKEAPNVD